MKSIAANMMTVLVVGGLVFLAAIGWGVERYKGEGPLTADLCVEVPRGATFASLSDDLAAKGAVSDGRLLRIGAQYSGRADKLKAGNFLVPAGTSMEEIVNIVTGVGVSSCGAEIVYRIGVVRADVIVNEWNEEANSAAELVRFDLYDEARPAGFIRTARQGATTHRLVVAEGTTSFAVHEALSVIDTLASDSAEVPPEGSLLPGSYEFKAGATMSSVLAEMQGQMQETLDAAWEGRDPNLPLETKEQMLILASIVEKETRPEEHAKVASVFVNRLNKGMKLQTDPTVIYGITEGKAPLGRGLRRSELAAATPYNTYIIQGLPPTPIANPGAESIRAVANPDDTPYFYFVADGTGGHAFAETLDQHNKNVAEWRKIERARQQNQ